MWPFDNPVMGAAFWGAAFGSLIFLLLQKVINHATASITGLTMMYGEMRALERYPMFEQTTVVTEPDPHPVRRKKNRWRNRQRRSGK